MAMGVNILQNGKVKFLRLKSKGGARFDIIEKNSDGEYFVANTTKIVNGALKSIDLKEGEYEGNKIYTVIIKLIDNDETYNIDISTETAMGRNTIASLLSIKELGHILQLSLYKTKNVSDPSKPYDNIGLSYDSEQLKWKYDLTDKTSGSGLAPVGTKKEKGKEMADYYERDMDLIEKLYEHISKLPEPTKLDPMPTGVESQVDNADIEQLTEEDIDTVFPTEGTTTKTTTRKTTEQNIDDKPF